MNKSIITIILCLLAVALVILILLHLLMTPVIEPENETKIIQGEKRWLNESVLLESNSSNDKIIQTFHIGSFPKPVPESVPEFHFKQITRAELEQILAETSIESIPRNHSFVCVDYTNELIRELLLKRGVQACQANIYFKAPTNHAFLAVNTSDEGIIYVEPQNDNILNWNDLIFHYTYMTRVTSCFGRQIPEPYECVYMDGIKKCNLAHSW